MTFFDSPLFLCYEFREKREMALINCPECGRSISDRARSVRNADILFRQESGLSVPDLGALTDTNTNQKRLFLAALVHIVYGPAYGGGLKPAKGFIAIGNIAIGVIAIGGMAVGVFTWRHRTRVGLHRRIGLRTAPRAGRAGHRLQPWVEWRSACMPSEGCLWEFTPSTMILKSGIL